MSTTLPPNAHGAREFLDQAVALGFEVKAKPGLVTIQRCFEPEDRAAYVSAESDAADLLDLVPIVASGSTWGTTSDSVGGHVGLTNGYHQMKISGVSKRFTAAICKIRAERGLTSVA